MNEEQSSRTKDRVGTLFLAALMDYSHAYAMGLAKSLAAADNPGGQPSRDWLDYDHARSEIAHAFASYVAFGRDPVPLVKVAGHGLGERAIVWCQRVSEDLAARLRGETGAIPSTDDLPPPPVTVTRL